MRRVILLFSMLVLFQLAAFAQPYLDYISEERGDTLVVLDEFGYGGADALNLCMTSDTVDVPAGRVYLLLNYGFYSLVNSPTSSATQKVVIMGESNESIKLRSDEAFPPIVCGSVWEGGTSIGNLRSGYDLLVKNIEANAGNSSGELGWTMFGTNASAKLTVENCIVEHNQWCLINPSAGSKVTFKDNYMLNFVGHACRRNGGVIDFFSNQDSIVVENNTILQAQGSLFKFRNGYSVNRSIFNHNTFINCAGYVFMNLGNTGNITVTNNMFINSNVQGYCSAFQSADAGEVDMDDLPMGLVNAYHDSASVANGETFYVDKNLVYWDPIFDDYISTLNTNQVNGTTNWASQMITMNSRTQEMFDDNTTYPYLTEGTWVEGVMPNFADPQDLFTTQVQNIKTYILATVDTSSTQTLPNWRLVNTPVEDNFVYSDWPVPVDLSYDNAALLTAAMGGLPLGDLDWFPTQKASWEAQRDAELTTISNVLYNGITATEESSVPESFQLNQNYPNPFNPTTVISFSIPEAGNVQLKVFNALGQEVATLVDGYKAVSEYKVNFDASNLSSGVYFYTLKVNDQAQTKKMLLLK